MPVYVYLGSGSVLVAAAHPNPAAVVQHTQGAQYGIVTKQLTQSQIKLTSKPRVRNPASLELQPKGKTNEPWMDDEIIPEVVSLPDFSEDTLFLQIKSLARASFPTKEDESITRLVTKCHELKAISWIWPS